MSVAFRLVYWICIWMCKMRSGIKWVFSFHYLGDTRPQVSMKFNISFQIFGKSFPYCNFRLCKYTTTFFTGLLFLFVCRHCAVSGTQVSDGNDPINHSSWFVTAVLQPISGVKESVNHAIVAEVEQHQVSFFISISHSILNLNVLILAEVFFCTRSSFFYRHFLQPIPGGNSRGEQRCYLPKYQTCHSTRIKSEFHSYFFLLQKSALFTVHERTCSRLTRLFVRSFVRRRYHARNTL